MVTDATDPLDGIDPESLSPADVDDAELRAALDASSPVVRRRGAAACATLAAADIDAVRPVLDAVAALAGDDESAVALHAIDALDAVAEADPDALDGRLSGLVDATDSEIVDVQLTAATALGKLVVARPDLLAPHATRLIAAVRESEPDRRAQQYGELVDHQQTRRALEEHEEAERRRLASGRRTLINVVVAVTEEVPESALDVVDDLVTLLDDVDPAISGGAVDALGELAAADPDAVAPVRGRLVDCLDHDRTVVRARAIRALGRLGDDTSVPDLRTVAEEDADADVREIAERTAAFLDDRSAGDSSA